MESGRKDCLPFRRLKEFWTWAENGGRKSFRMDELDDSLIIEKDASAPVPYLKKLADDVETADNT